MFSLFPSNGMSSRAATNKTCRTIETSIARRLPRRARFSISESPSSRQAFRDTLRSPESRPGTITHLRRMPLRAVGVLRHQPPEIAFRRPAPLSQGCEVRASSEPFDTTPKDKFPRGGKPKRALYGRPRAFVASGGRPGGSFGGATRTAVTEILIGRRRIRGKWRQFAARQTSVC